MKKSDARVFTECFPLCEVQERAKLIYYDWDQKNESHIVCTEGYWL